MGRGLGDTQRAALTILADKSRSISELAEALLISERQAHQVVDALRERGLIWTRIHGGFDGAGKVGAMGECQKDDEGAVPFVFEIVDQSAVTYHDRYYGRRVRPHVSTVRRAPEPDEEPTGWMRPRGLPKREMWVHLGDPPTTVFGTLDRRGR